MPRLPRLVVPDQPLHIIQRGNNRSPSFVSADDRHRYVTVLHEASVRARCAIHAYVLMTNHVHLLVTPSDEKAAGRMIQLLGGRYVRYFNTRHGRTGTLWEGRYRSTPIESERYFFKCSRYIELNPVRAGIVEHPGDYRWSSFRGNAAGEPDRLITQHPLYRALGAHAAERGSAYRALFDVELEPETIDFIRRATNAGSVLGRDQFRQRIEKARRRRAVPTSFGGRPGRSVRMVGEHGVAEGT